MLQVKIHRRKRRFGIVPIYRLCRELETEHQLDVTKVGVSPTFEFLTALAAQLTARLRLAVTPTAAYCLWKAVFDLLESARQKTAPLCDVAFWYGIDPFNLTDTQQIGLIANLPRVKAQDTLHSGDYNDEDYKYIYSLVLLATDDKRAAEKARSVAMERYVDACIARANK